MAYRKGFSRILYHVAHLVGNILQPILDTFSTRNHPCKFRPDDGLRMERLAKHFALCRPPVPNYQHRKCISRLKWRTSSIPQLLGSHDHMSYRARIRSLLILRWLLAEAQHIVHRSWLKLLSQRYSMIVDNSYVRSLPEDDENSSTLFTKSVFRGHFDIIKGDISGASCCWITRFDLLSFHSRPSFD